MVVGAVAIAAARILDPQTQKRHQHARNTADQKGGAPSPVVTDYAAHAVTQGGWSG